VIFHTGEFPLCQLHDPSTHPLPPKCPPRNNNHPTILLLLLNLHNNLLNPQTFLELAHPSRRSVIISVRPAQRPSQLLVISPDTFAFIPANATTNALSPAARLVVLVKTTYSSSKPPFTPFTLSSSCLVNLELTNFGFLLLIIVNVWLSPSALPTYSLPTLLRFPRVTLPRYYRSPNLNSKFPYSSLTS
jgi:hypothetical protein